MNNPDPIKASATLIEYLLYLDVVFLILVIFASYSKTFMISILIVNIIFIFISIGLKKDAQKITMYRSF